VRSRTFWNTVWYASWSLVKRYPVTRCKINRSFIAKTYNGKADEAIVKAVMFLADNLRLQVIAENVRTVEPQDLLKRCGCGQVQGELHGKLMLAGELGTSFSRSCSRGRALSYTEHCYKPWCSERCSACLPNGSFCVTSEKDVVVARHAAEEQRLSSSTLVLFDGSRIALRCPARHFRGQKRR
jgi:hypothetical protein